LLKILAKNEVCCCFWPPPKKKSSKPCAELISGRQRHGANDAGSHKHAAELALKGQFGTQCLLHPTQRVSLAATRGKLQSSRSDRGW
jgi:hypothetical protein